jgi:hypothetical protein
MSSEFVTLTCHVVSAQPGHYALVADGDFSQIDHHPVVAWQIDSDGVAEPIAYGLHNASKHPVLFPNGQVLDQGNKLWPSVFEWLADLRAKRDARKSKG